MRRTILAQAPGHKVAGPEKEPLSPRRRRSNLRLVRKQKPVVYHAGPPGSAASRAVIAGEARITSHVPLGQLLEATKMMLWEAEVENWRFTYVSEHAKKMLGYAPAKWYEPDFLASHLHPEDKHPIFCQRQSRVAEHKELVFRMFASDGRVVWVRTFITLVSTEGHVKRMSGFMVDVSETKHAEEAMRDLSGRLIAAQETERSRIARELHDDFNQRLALLSIELEQLGKQIQKPDLRQPCLKFQKQVQDISADIQGLSHRLHPAKLDHLGLSAAIRSLCEELSAGADLKIEFHQHRLPPTIPKDVALCLFRIAQEALRNCIKHSGADKAQVALSRTRDAIRLCVSDDGAGFDPKVRANERGLGFVSMRERLHVVSGELNVYSEPGCGTRVEVAVPLVQDMMFVI
jgi:PAS domain S-box-containing protein